jgi:hypothetical protein
MRVTNPRPLTCAALLLLGSLAVSCGQETDAPAAPAATPAPTPAPAPTPTPAPTPIGLGCGLSKGTGTGEGCPRENPSFLKEVDTAINRVVEKQPRLFDLNDSRGGGGYLILNRNKFYAAVVDELNLMGLCAIDDGVEVSLKNTNKWNDQYRIDLSTGHIRRGESSYRATCYPAYF